jgi:hypothetical protein
VQHVKETIQRNSKKSVSHIKLTTQFLEGASANIKALSGNFFALAQIFHKEKTYPLYKFP